jgi:hypothetical protein
MVQSEWIGYFLLQYRASDKNKDGKNKSNCVESLWIQMSNRRWIEVMVGIEQG